MRQVDELIAPSEDNHARTNVDGKSGDDDDPYWAVECGNAEEVPLD
jgi:hypothetical protein